jgi:hypothetical protein
MIKLFDAPDGTFSVTALDASKSPPGVFQAFVPSRVFQVALVVHDCVTGSTVIGCDAVLVAAVSCT